MPFNSGSGHTGGGGRVGAGGGGQTRVSTLLPSGSFESRTQILEEFRNLPEDKRN